MAIEGGCRCGAVRFGFEAEPISVRACWCRDCQYVAAGSSTVNVVFPSAALTLTGDTADYVETAASGAIMHRRFCPKCGTPLFSEAEIRPHLTIVRGGTLDDPELARPQSVIWTGSAPTWACMDADLPAFEGPPPPA
jgi:hypothetical protein